MSALRCASPLERGQSLGFGPQLGAELLGLGRQLERHLARRPAAGQGGHVLDVARRTQHGVEHERRAGDRDGHRAPR